VSVIVWFVNAVFNVPSTYQTFTVSLSWIS
jgi:hypothetical protein